jgi:REP element-mobilizing transposase RayT
LSDGYFHANTHGVDEIAIFRDDDDRRAFLRLLAYVVRKDRWTCHAFCLMTTHYHVVVEAVLEDLSAGFRRLNGVYAQRFNRRHGREGHLFGDRFWSEQIESDEHLAAACRYVVANPVRAGLCATPVEWRWNGSRYGFDA